MSVSKHATKAWIYLTHVQIGLLLEGWPITCCTSINVSLLFAFLQAEIGSLGMGGDAAETVALNGANVANGNNNGNTIVVEGENGNKSNKNNIKDKSNFDVLRLSRASTFKTTLVWENNGSETNKEMNEVAFRIFRSDWLMTWPSAECYLNAWEHISLPCTRMM